MKRYKWFFPILVAILFVSCGSDSEDELLGNWTKRGDFGGGQRYHAAYFIIGNKGYVCCGSNTSKVRLKDVWEYNNDKQGWRGMAEFPGTARQQAVGFSVNGKGYVGTGWDGKDLVMKDFWEFDPTGGPTGPDGLPTGSWREVAPLPDQARERHSAVAFTLKIGEKEYGYVGTGYTEGDQKLVLKDIWRYDPGDGPLGSWTLIADYDGNKRYGATVFVINNKAYLLTGKSFNTTNIVDVWMYTPEEDKWEQKRKIAEANPDEDYDNDYIGMSRAWGVSFVMPVNGETRGFMALGTGKSDVWEYDAVNDLWTKRTSFYSNATPSNREGAMAFSFPGTGQAFVGLGGSSAVPFDDFWEFFPTAKDDTYDDF